MVFVGELTWEASMIWYLTVKLTWETSTIWSLTVNLTLQASSKWSLTDFDVGSIIDIVFDCDRGMGSINAIFGCEFDVENVKDMVFDFEFDAFVKAQFYLNQ